MAAATLFSLGVVIYEALTGKPAFRAPRQPRRSIRYVLKLIQGKSAKELPQASGAPQQMTFGEGKWHVHGGAWSLDSRSIVYTRDFDSGNLSVIDHYP